MHSYDYFIAVPMSCLPQEEYISLKAELHKLHDALQAAGKKIFCAPIDSEFSNFKLPALAYKIDKYAIESARHFVIILPGKHYTSALVEWGWADMLGLPVTICATDAGDIPWMMRALPESHPERAELVIYDKPSDITAHLLARQPRHRMAEAA